MGYASSARRKASRSAAAALTSSIPKATRGRSSGPRAPRSTTAAVSSFPKTFDSPEKRHFGLLHFEGEHHEHRPQSSRGSRRTASATQVEARLGRRYGHRRRRSGGGPVDVHDAHARRRRHDPPDRAPAGGRLRDRARGG